MTNDKIEKYSLNAPLTLAKRMNENDSIAPEYRNAFMRDRDRVLYSSAFRRLSGKTQIYLTGSDDHRRNRLTHTLEVSQIARTISKALGLDEDLTEAIALGHDLGHAPFGHAGEQILHEIMVPESRVTIKNSPMNKPDLTLNLREDALKRQPLFGFKHNIQGVRIVSETEDSYGKDGLNLTNYTLWGIAHHSSLKYKMTRVNVRSEYLEPTYQEQYIKKYLQKDSEDLQAWSFEAYVVAVADEIAQWHHDLEDALRSDAMTLRQVCTQLKDNLLINLSEEDALLLENLAPKNKVYRQDLAIISRIVVNNFVSRIIDCSEANLQKLWKDFLEDNPECTEPQNEFFKKNSWDEPKIFQAIGFKKFVEDDGKADKIGIRFGELIGNNIHHSFVVERMNAKGQYIIKKLFQTYYSHPQQLPDSIIIHYMVFINKYETIEIAREEGTGRVRTKFADVLSNPKEFTLEYQIYLMRYICDHIAGMTDRFALEEYTHLYE